MPPNRPVTEEAIASRPDSVGVALVVISATGFGTLGILAKLAYTEGLDLPSTLAWRFLGAAVVFWAWLV